MLFFLVSRSNKGHFELSIIVRRSYVNLVQRSGQWRNYWIRVSAEIIPLLTVSHREQKKVQKTFSVRRIVALLVSWKINYPCSVVPLFMKLVRVWSRNWYGICFTRQIYDAIGRKMPFSPRGVSPSSSRLNFTQKQTNRESSKGFVTREWLAIDWEKNLGKFSGRLLAFLSKFEGIFEAISSHDNYIEIAEKLQCDENIHHTMQWGDQEVFAWNTDEENFCVLPRRVKCFLFPVFSSSWARSTKYREREKKLACMPPYFRTNNFRVFAAREGVWEWAKSC